MFNLIPWKEQKKGIESFWKSIDSVFDEFNKSWKDSFSDIFDFDTGVDIKEDESTITVNVNLPYEDAKDETEVELIKQRYLKVKYESENKSFYQTVLLPYKVDNENFNAEYKDDKMVITLNKVDDPDVKKIEIN